MIKVILMRAEVTVRFTLMVKTGVRAVTGDVFESYTVDIYNVVSKNLPF